MSRHLTSEQWRLENIPLRSTLAHANLTTAPPLFGHDRDGIATMRRRARRQRPAQTGAGQ
jgi:hypothetical protein